MKFLALVQIVCIVLLSSFSMMVKPAASTDGADCCRKSDKLTSCHHQSKTADKANDTEGCNRMLSCNTCGFLGKEPVSISPLCGTLIEKPASNYKMGKSTGYVPTSWKPPKV